MPDLEKKPDLFKLTSEKIEALAKESYDLRLGDLEHIDCPQSMFDFIDNKIASLKET